jgi:mannosyltransferase OCH1-like enzyme
LDAPKIVQFWDDGNPPSLIANRMQAWRYVNQDWDYVCFNRISAADFLREVFGQSLYTAFLDIRMPAMMSDVFRVAHTMVNGGLWVDAATTCLEPLSMWLDISEPLILLRKPHMQPPLVWNGFIFASDQNHLFLTAVWEKIVKSICSRSGSNVWRHMGPGLYRDILQAGDYDHCLRVMQTDDLATKIQYGSSGEAVPAEQHWSKRQLHESLYFSIAPAS